MYKSLNQAQMVNQYQNLISHTSKTIGLHDNGIIVNFHNAYNILANSQTVSTMT